MAEWNWQLVTAGRFRLDGGSMFGVVPQVLWQKLVTPDTLNRIPLACHCLLLERDENAGADRVRVRNENV